MKRQKLPPASLAAVRLWWYPLALVPVALLVAAPLLGWLPGLVFPLGLFILFFWLFSFAFAIYARIGKPREPRK